MTEHTLTIEHDTDVLRLSRGSCSCGQWKSVGNRGPLGSLVLDRDHAEHVQTEADWDAIEEALSWMPALTGRAVEALARLRGR